MTDSAYGKYEIQDSLELDLPRTQIKIKRLGDSMSYYRKDSQDNQVEKIIPLDTYHPTIELAPIRPLNHPARRTSYMYLELDRTVHLIPEAAVKIFVRCPIEIGVFLTGTKSSSLDCFTCAPTVSRFGLYGPSDTGMLCKYYKASIVESLTDSVPYHNGVMPITITNDIERGEDIDKLVFLMTDVSVYYHEQSAIFDGITVNMKKRGKSNLADISAQTIDTEWTRSPTWEATTTSQSLEMGLD